MEVPYADCCLFEIGNTECGPYLPRKSVNLFHVYELDRVVSRLTKDGFKDKSINLREDELISNRSGHKILADDKICPKHRFTYGIDWRNSKLCQHPLHPPCNPKSTKKSCGGLRPASYNIQEVFPKFPIAGSLCSAHRNNPLPSPAETQAHSDTSCDAYEPPPHAVASTTREDFERIVEPITDDVSPMKYVIRSSLMDLSDLTLRYAKRKFNEMTNTFAKKVCEGIAPGQGEELFTMFSTAENNSVATADELITNELQPLIEAFRCTDSEKMKILILSTIDPKKYTKQEVSQAFETFQYKVTKARKSRAIYGPGSEPPLPAKNTKDKMNREKAEHFLDFVFSTGALQDVAYGVSTMNNDTGFKEMLPNVVITCLRNHVIRDYREYCSGFSYQPLSDTSLWKILNAIKPKQRHALGGLDNTTADGITAFDQLLNVIPTENKSELLNNLEIGKRYLKLGYHLHCSGDSACSTHCRAYSLSNAADSSFQKECSHSHSITCSKCHSLLLTLDNIELLVQQEADLEKKVELTYDSSLSSSMIIEWMRHIVRDSQQAKAKSEVMTNLDSETALWLKDWAQKVLPQSFREKQSEYFGKKGMSVAIDVFFFKPADSNTMQKVVYFTVLQNCSQDMVSSLSVADHVLEHFHSTHPEISKVHIKSDNAGSYSGAARPESEYRICEKRGICLLRHDFNEPQRGKDQADRESAVARGYMKAYLNSGHNIKSAHDIKEAILYKGGVKNAFVSVIEIDMCKATLPTVKIVNITSYHSIKFGKDAMTFWQYFNIGSGKAIQYSHADFTSGVVIIEPFVSTNMQNCSQERKKRLDRMYQSLFFCPNAGCTNSFEDEESLEQHLVVGSHNRTGSVSQSDMDAIKLSVSARMRTSSHLLLLADKADNPQDLSVKDSKHVAIVTQRGWAIKRSVRARLIPHQNEFIVSCFEQGEKTRRKMTADQVVETMRTARDSTGKKLFFPDEYLTRTQVISQFSQLKRKKTKNVSNPKNSDEPHDSDMDDALDEVHEEALQREKDEILLELEDFAPLQFQPGDFVLVSLGEKCCVGTILKVHLGSGTLQIKYLRQQGSYYVLPASADVSVQSRTLTKGSNIFLMKRMLTRLKTLKPKHWEENNLILID